MNKLLAGWANWVQTRENGKLGYAVSKINRLMNGESISTGGSYGAIIPYGIDESAVYSTIDRIINKLPQEDVRLLNEEFCKIGLQTAKAQYLGISLANYRVKLNRVKFKIQNNQEIQYIIKKI